MENTIKELEKIYNKKIYLENYSIEANLIEQTEIISNDHGDFLIDSIKENFGALETLTFLNICPLGNLEQVYNFSELNPIVFAASLRHFDTPRDLFKLEDDMLVWDVYKKIQIKTSKNKEKYFLVGTVLMFHNISSSIYKYNEEERDNLIKELNQYKKEKSNLIEELKKEENEYFEKIREYEIQL